MIFSQFRLRYCTKRTAEHRPSHYPNTNVALKTTMTQSLVPTIKRTLILILSLAFTRSFTPELITTAHTNTYTSTYPYIHNSTDTPAFTDTNINTEALSLIFFFAIAIVNNPIFIQVLVAGPYTQIHRHRRTETLTALKSVLTLILIPALSLSSAFSFPSSIVLVHATVFMSAVSSVISTNLVENLHVYLHLLSYPILTPTLTLPRTLVWAFKLVPILTSKFVLVGAFEIIAENTFHSYSHPQLPEE